MKIILADHFGMCFGVRDAIAQAEALAASGPLTILGELVHNPVVREQLRARGVREGSLDDPGSVASQNVMITAHGAADLRHANLRAAGYTLADATCPLVRHAHGQLATLVRGGYFPVVIGQPGHVEVRGLTEDFPSATVINDLADVANLPEKPRYGVISQTTQPIGRVRNIVAAIRRAHPQAEVRFADTVCKPTKDRQLALQHLIAQTELIVVVGGRASNNTLQLIATCRQAGHRTIHIERAEELVASEFANVTVVGLTAGTSTLPETVQAAHDRLREFALCSAKTKSA
jgi:4-hydroxy-3-methylbut-2-enyl diphosphate reductase